MCIRDSLWADEAAQRAMVSAYVVTLEHDGELQIWEPQAGRILRDRRWAGHTLLRLDGGQLSRRPLPAWKEPGESRCLLRGTVQIKSDGSFSGQFTVQTSGLFVSPEKLRSGDAQKDRLAALLRRVLPEAGVKSFSITALSPSQFAAEAEVSGPKLKQINDRHWLSLAEDGPLAAEVSLPLETGLRRTPVRLVGPFEELIELTIEWPTEWTLEVQPIEIATTSSPWGELTQSVATDGNRLKLTRRTLLARRELSRAEFPELRDLLNRLRAPAGRTLVFKP